MTDSAKQDAPKAETEQADEEPTQAQAQEQAREQDSGSEAKRDLDEAKPDLDEVKRKFREALERKRQVHAEGQGKGGQDTGKIHGAHGPAASRRSFRRKSG